MNVKQCACLDKRRRYPAIYMSFTIWRCPVISVIILVDLTKGRKKKKHVSQCLHSNCHLCRGTYNIIQLVTTFSDTPWHTHSSSYFYECCEALSEIHRPFPALSHCETRTFSATLRLEGSWMQPRFHLTHYGKNLEKDRSYLHIW